MSISPIYQVVSVPSVSPLAQRNRHRENRREAELELKIQRKLARAKEAEEDAGKALPPPDLA